MDRELRHAELPDLVLLRLCRPGDAMPGERRVVGDAVRHQSREQLLEWAKNLSPALLIVWVSYPYIRQLCRLKALNNLIESGQLVKE